MKITDPDHPLHLRLGALAAQAKAERAEGTKGRKGARAAWVKENARKGKPKG